MTYFVIILPVKQKKISYLVYFQSVNIIQVGMKIAYI